MPIRTTGADLLHFSGDLSTQKAPSGWMGLHTRYCACQHGPSYSGTSSYLLFSKACVTMRNGDGDGINKITLLDPNATQIDPHPTANGLVEMRKC